MHLALTSTQAGVGQLIAVILIFVFVLAITGLTTKWIGNYQREKSIGDNIAVIESKSIAQNKAIEIVRIGDRYFAIALGKDTVTLLAELSKDSLSLDSDIKENAEKISFKEFLNKAKDNGEE